jgi:hypothetical protein
VVEAVLHAMVCAGLADRVSVPWPLLAGGRFGCAGVGSLTPWWVRLRCGNRESGADERTPCPPDLGGVGGADKIQRNATTRKSVVGRGCVKTRDFNVAPKVSCKTTFQIELWRTIVTWSRVKRPPKKLWS